MVKIELSFVESFSPSVHHSRRPRRTPMPVTTPHVGDPRPPLERVLILSRSLAAPPFLSSPQSSNRAEPSMVAARALTLSHRPSSPRSPLRQLLSIPCAQGLLAWPPTHFHHPQARPRATPAELALTLAGHQAPLKLRAARRAFPPVLLRPNQGRGELPLDALILPGPFSNLHRLPPHRNDLALAARAAAPPLAPYRPPPTPALASNRP